MINEISSPEERRMMILEGIDQDLTPLEIAEKMGVDRWRVLKDIKYMKYNRDSELKQAYIDRESRLLKKKQLISNAREKRFHLMTGKTIQEKTFENMINYYKPELNLIMGSKKEYLAIMKLDKSIQRVLKHNEIITGRRDRRQISKKARGFLSKSG
ncbi:hypothetical protein JW865_08470 [Candidatus Bathyarchaeota archaeon]|nr:hypothetical protein [Candidatus Bathyarchaeota archaeon]